MIVMKFGGSSVGSADAIRHVGRVVSAAKDHEPVVVVSALSGITDSLLEAADGAQQGISEPRETVATIRARHEEVCAGLGLDANTLLEPLDELESFLHGVHHLRELTARSQDFILSHGEILSSRIVAAHLSSIGVPAHPLTGWDAGIVTDACHGEGGVLDDTYEQVRLRCKYGGSVPVVTGFLGATTTGERTTLGRGGSDYTAAILGRALQADEIQIWTDVSGIYSADPRIVPSAFSLEELSFEEAAELAFFGAKVLHPKTIEPAVKSGIPVRVLNTFEPDHPGTRIVGGSRKTKRAIVGLAAKKDNFVLTIESTRMLDAEGYLSRVFEVLHRYQVSVDAIATSEVSVCMTIESRYREGVQEAAKDLAEVAHVELNDGHTLICVVGQGLRENPGTAAKVFTAMGDAEINIEMISMGSSKINLTFVVADNDLQGAMCALHDTVIQSGSSAV